MSFFSVSDLTAGYSKTPVLNKVSFELDEGCLTGILGSNGSGKTTLLKAVCGILPHRGSCVLDHASLDRLSLKKLAGLCGYIPQRSGITIDISVLDVVLMGFNPELGLLERPDRSMRHAARQALAQTGLEGMEDANYLHLSEGQKQLCILARTLIAPRKLLLLDEPESALDFRFRARMFEILRGWLGKEKRLILATLHDPLLALNYCDRLLILSEGKIRAILAPASDPLPKMEQELESIYGRVSLHSCARRDGCRQLVMLKEPDGQTAQNQFRNGGT